MHYSLLLTIVAGLNLVGCKTGAKERASDAKVIGGVVTSRLPQIGLLKRMGGGYCTGTLIAVDTVVTAAHCLTDAEPGDFSFVMQQDQASPAVAMSVSAFKIHPKYDQSTNNFDIGLVKLTSKAAFPPLGVVRSLDPVALIGKKLTTIGYGRAKKPSEASVEEAGIGIKREADLTVTAVSETKIRVEELGKSACYGDSGGAYLQMSDSGEPLLVGVTSCGDTNCSSYGVATRIDTFLDFLGLDSRVKEPSFKSACDTSYNHGVCSEDTIKICRNDCYEVKLEESTCTAGKTCRINPVNGTAGCYDPKNLQKLTLNFKRLKIVDGRYEPGPALTDLYLFFDRPETKFLPQIGQHSLTVSASGSVDLELELGEHYFEGAILQGSSGSAFVPKRVFSVNRDTRELSFTVPTDLVRVEVGDDVGFDRAVYITGQGELLGNWQRGEKLKYSGKTKSWTYHGTLAKDLEFKLFVGPWVPDTHLGMSGKQIRWEPIPGNHRVGEGGIPYNGGYYHRIKL